MASDEFNLGQRESRYNPRSSLYDIQSNFVDLKHVTCDATYR